MKPYYYVYRTGGSRGPVVKHPTVESAVAESHRLAGQHPGETFEILKCLATTRTTEPSTFWNDGEGPATPGNGCRYFLATDNGCAWRASPDGSVHIAIPGESEWEESICSLDDLIESEGTREITSDQLPHPIEP